MVDYEGNRSSGTLGRDLRSHPGSLGGVHTVDGLLNALLRLFKRWLGGSLVASFERGLGGRLLLLRVGSGRGAL
jgi:hypothetical protein